MAGIPVPGVRGGSVVGSGLGALPLVLALAGGAAAQVPGSPVEVSPRPPLSAERGVSTLPPVTLAAPDPNPGFSSSGPIIPPSGPGFSSSGPVIPPSGLGTLPPGPASAPPGRPVRSDPFGCGPFGCGPSGCGPFGCGPSGCDRPEDPFTFLTTSGSTWSVFPRTLLWEPPLANLREPRFLGLPNGLSNPFTDQTVDFAIGNTLGLLRRSSADGRRVWQLDLFAVVYSRFSDYDYFVGADYRAGLPLTFAAGPWHGKIGYEHTSTHLGDETLVRFQRLPIDYIKDELVLAVGRYFGEQRLRVYGQVAWAFYQRVPDDPSPFRFDIGAEWVRRRATGPWGQPFAAGNLEFNGASDYNPSLSLQAGWLWRDPGRRLAQGRLFGQYYTGYSPLGQFYLTREDWFGFGFAVDY